jgi:integrase
LRMKLAQVEHASPYILTSQYGGPFKATSITNAVCDACSDFGFPGYSPHGLRHLAGAELAEAGCSMHEIMSILGHLTEKEAAHYVRQAQRKKMAQSGMDKWAAH